MGFEKIRLGKDEIFEIIVKDANGHKVEEWKCMKKDFPKVINILLKKFGLKMETKEQVGNKDLDWAK